MYTKGKGVKKNLKNAVVLLQKAVDQNLDYSQYKLALMYENGEGVKKDPAMAKALYRLAATQGYSLAKKKLGMD